MADQKYLPNEETDLLEELFRRNAVLEKQVADLERAIRNQDTPGTLPRIDPTTYPSPYEGQRAIDLVDEQHTWYSDGAWRKAKSNPIYHIKVRADTQLVIAGDGAFIWAIPQDVGGMNLLDVELDVTTVSSSGIVQVQVRNVTQAADMLSTRVQVDASEYHSKDAATQPVVDTGNDDVAHGDRIAIDVDAAGTGAKGLGIVLTFGL